MEDAWRLRQTLMEVMVKTHLVTTDVANEWIKPMSDADVCEELKLYQAEQRLK